jgi:hypothetical protein
LIEAKNSQALPIGFGYLRQMIFKSGVDPYLEFLQKRSAAGETLFSGVPHKVLDPPAEDIRLIRLDGTTEKRSRWCKVLDFAFPSGILLVLDGWTGIWVNAGDGKASTVRPRLVDIARPPFLFGDTERHLPSEQRGQSWQYRLDVQPIDKKFDAVHALYVPHSLVQEWCKHANVEVDLQLHAIKKAHARETWLAIGNNKEWRIIRWLLDEHRRTQASRGSGRIWIPKSILGYKLISGAKQGEFKQFRENKKKALTRSMKILNWLANRTFIEWTPGPDDDEDTIRVRVLDEEGLTELLSLAAVDSLLTPRRKKSDKV